MKEYRRKTDGLWVAVLCIAFYVLMGAVSVVVALLPEDGGCSESSSTAAEVGYFWGFMALLSIWLLVDQVRSRLVVSEEGLVQVGVFISKGIAFEEVELARWRRLPRGGQLLLSGNGRRMIVELDQYSTADRVQLIESVRNSIPMERQTGWEKFDQAIVPWQMNPRGSLALALVIALLFCAGGVATGMAAWAGFSNAAEMTALVVVNLSGVAFSLWIARRTWRNLRRAQVCENAVAGSRRLEG